MSRNSKQISSSSLLRTGAAVAVLLACLQPCVSAAGQQQSLNAVMTASDYAAGLMSAATLIASVPPSTAASLTHSEAPQAAVVYQMITPTEALPTVPALYVPKAVVVPAVKLYDVSACQSDIASVLNSLAQDAHVSIVMANGAAGKVTMNLHQVSFNKAIDLLTKAAGLAYHEDGSTYVIGSAPDMATAYPQDAPDTTDTVYRCQHIRATDLVTALQNTFDKGQLHVSLGAASYSPRLDDSASQAAAVIRAGAGQSSSSSAVASDPGLASRSVILSGSAAAVNRALALAQQLDVRRRQVRISVRITDISVDAERNLGLQWTFGNVSATENGSHGLNLGSFTRSPFSVNAAISALQSKNLANLLAAPTITLLDGEHGYILIGERLLYPVLVGYTQAQTPIFDKAEENVGIYMQVAAEVGDNGDITMSIYPQVSEVTGYLKVNEASYPQISTREQQTTVRVQDAQQIVIGGLLQDDDINNLQQVPGLSKIPFFGQLFSTRDKTRTRNEVVIIITPEILKD